MLLCGPGLRRQRLRCDPPGHGHGDRPGFSGAPSPRRKAAPTRSSAGDVKKSRHSVSFPVDLQGNEIVVKVYLVDGSVPFLQGRSTSLRGVGHRLRLPQPEVHGPGQRPMVPDVAERQGPHDLQPPGRLDVQNPHRGRCAYCPRWSGSWNSAVGILLVAAVRLPGSIRVGDGDRRRNPFHAHSPHRICYCVYYFRRPDRHRGPYRDDTHYYFSGLGSSSTSSRSSDESEPGPDFDDDGDDALLGIDVNPFGDEFLILKTELSVEGPPPLRDDQHLEDAEVLLTSAQRELFDAPLEPPLARPKMIWEIFVDEGRLSSASRSTAPTASPLSSSRRTMAAISWTTPPARTSSRDPTPRSRARSSWPLPVILGARCRTSTACSTYGADFCERLGARRAGHERCFLTLCRRLYDGQALDGLHAHIEAPWTANSFKTKTWSNTCGYDARLDQCRFQST